MVASTDIKFYVHTNSNVPQLQNAYGSMINVLDACLINGVNIGIVSSLTVSDTTVTALFSSAHNLMQYQVIKITGANQPEFNGEHRILTVPNAQSITFELAAAPSTMTATGTITASLPPLGWEKPFSSTNVSGGGKAAYRSKNLLLPSRPFLRVVDELDPAYTATYAKYAKVGIVEDMTDINTMLGVQAPFDAVNPDKNWTGSGSGTSAINGWAKWYYARSSDITTSTADTGVATEGNRKWVIVGNGGYFYILPASIANSNTTLPYGFGLFNALLDTDNSNTFLSSTCNYAAVSATGNKGANTSLVGDSSTQLLLLQRAYNQTASSITSQCTSLKATNGNISTGLSNHFGPASLGGGIPLLPIFIKESVLRGSMIGINWLYQERPYEDMQIFKHNQSLFIAVATGSSGTTVGQIALKIGDLNDG